MFFSHRSVKETSVFLNKSVYLGLLILELSKILICGFLHNFVKPKYREKPKLRYMDTGNFIVYKKTEDIYWVIAKDDETRFDTSNNESDSPLPKEKTIIYWINDSWIRWKNNDSVCCIETKNVYLFNKYQRWKQKNKKHKKVCHQKET